MTQVGERRSYSAGDKLPESIGDKLPESTGDMDSTWVSVFRRGTNLILRLLGMLAEECLYSAGEC